MQISKSYVQNLIPKEFIFENSYHNDAHIVFLNVYLKISQQLSLFKEDENIVDSSTAEYDLDPMCATKTRKHWFHK